MISILLHLNLLKSFDTEVRHLYLQKLLFEILIKLVYDTYHNPQSSS